MVELYALICVARDPTSLGYAHRLEERALFRDVHVCTRGPKGRYYSQGVTVLGSDDGMDQGLRQVVVTWVSA